MTQTAVRASDAPGRPQGQRAYQQISLVDLLDRLLGTGVVLAGDVLVSMSGVDLVEIRLHALITSVRSDLARPTLPGERRHD